MPSLFEIIFANAWNIAAIPGRRKFKGGFAIGYLIVDGKPTKHLFYIPNLKRAEHIVIIGKTGSGKSYLLRYFCLQDILASRGFIYIDHHGDTIPFLLSAMAEEQARTGVDFASRVIVVSPGDPHHAVGLNVLEAEGEHETFVQAGALTAILKERWGMEHFGARTE